MGNVIIGIHGLGNKPSKELLEKWWRQAMEEGLKANNFGTNLPKFEMVYWADITYDKPLSDEVDMDSPYYLDEGYTKAPLYFPKESSEIRRKIIDFIGRQLNRIFLNDDFSLNYSSLTDAILIKYFRDLDLYYSEEDTAIQSDNQKVKDLINNRLTQVLQKYKKHDILLISHSMGSIISYEVLNFVAPKIPIHTFVTIGSPLGLPQVISKIAAEQKQIDGNLHDMLTPQSISKSWYNFSDIKDKVAINYALGDDFSANNKGVKPVDFLVVNDYKMNGESNPHKSYGYLRTPEFANILNDFICTERLRLFEKIIRRIKNTTLRFK